MKATLGHPIAALGAVVAASVLPLHGATTTIYNEAFSGSSLGSPVPPPPTATTTAYQVLSTKNATGSSLGGSSLNLVMSGTTSGLAEMQALFTTSAITLNSGESITLQLTFTTTNVLDSVNDSINVGLFDSGGLGPVPGNALANAGLGSGTTYPTGNAEDWNGYVARIGSSFGDFFTRDDQTETTNEAQDVLFTNVGTGAYDAPSGTSVASSGTAGLSFTNGSTYTLVLDISYDGTDITIDEEVYSGAGTGGSNLYSRSGSAAATYTTFDSLAFGYRETTGGTGPTLAVSALTVSYATVPEPTAALLGSLGVIALFRRRRA